MKKKKILNVNRINKIIEQKFPNLILEARSKQFLESVIIFQLKKVLKNSSLYTKHRKGKILKVCDLKGFFSQNLPNKSNSLSFFKNFIIKKKVNSVH